MNKGYAFILVFQMVRVAAFGQTLTASTYQLNFGTVYENSADSLQLVISNNLGKVVNVTGIKFYDFYGAPAFSVANSTFQIADAASQLIWVKFSPVHNIYHNSEMVIESDAKRGAVSIDLTGQGKYSIAYYDSTQNYAEEDLKTRIHDLTGIGYNTLGYNVARDSMFMWLDNEKANGQGALQNTLECVYTGREAVGYIDRTDCQNNHSFNTEHTWPQNLFGSAEPMKSDLHHLFPTDDLANNTRANYPFGIVTNATWQNGGSKFDNNTNIFEPRDLHKGAAARAMLYFVLRYQNYSSFLNSQEAILKTWNKNFLPTQIQKNRNDDIFVIQQNRNPFVDYPQLADRITSFSTLSASSAVESLDWFYNTIDYGTITANTSYIYSFVIVNNGNQPAQLSNFTLSNTGLLNFISGNSTTILQPGEALTIQLNITPTSAGAINEQLLFTTSIPSLPTIQVPIIANVIPVSMDEINVDNLFLYPSPVTETLHFKFSKSINNTVSWLVLNTVGQIVMNNAITDLGDEQRIKVDDLPEGVYFLCLTTRNGSFFYQKFVKN